MSKFKRALHALAIGVAGPLSIGDTSWGFARSEKYA